MHSIHSLLPGKRGAGCRSSFIAKSLVIILLVFANGIGNDAFSQSGGRKRERKVRKRGDFILTQYKSRGHADEFAKGNRRGWFSRIFKKDRPAWQYRTSGSSRSNYKENRFLFFRHRSEGHQQNATNIEKQTRKRDRERRHGNETFKSRKFKKRK
jgi:hypothetical protein